MSLSSIALLLAILITQPLLAMTNNDIEQELIKINASPYININSSEFTQLDTNKKNNGIYIIIASEKESLWGRPEKISHHISLLKKTLSQCDIHLKGFLNVSLSLNKNFDRLLNNRSSQTPVIETKIFNTNTQFSYPLFFLLNKRSNYNTAKAFTDDFLKRMKRINRDVSNLKNTMWITDNFEDYKDTPNALPSYSVISHEIAHLIGDLKHVQTSTPNLMNASDDKDSKSHALTAQQCKQANDQMSQNTELLL